MLGTFGRRWNARPEDVAAAALVGWLALADQVQSDRDARFVVAAWHAWRPPLREDLSLEELRRAEDWLVLIDALDEHGLRDRGGLELVAELEAGDELQRLRSLRHAVAARARAGESSPRATLARAIERRLIDRADPLGAANPIDDGERARALAGPPGPAVGVVARILRDL